MLRTLADHLEVIWGALLAAAIVVLLTPAVGGMARLLGAVDRPEGRRLNRSTVPRLGGLALFFGIFVPALAFLDLSREARGLLLGAAVATTVGAVDDFRGLRWWEKLGGQLVAAAIPVASGIWVHRFTFPILGIHSLPDWVGMPLSVLWIVAIMNMVNFLDGLDGLAAGVSAISAFTFTLIALSLPRPEIQAALLSAIVLGAALGFLRHNVYPARIFMGDSGALLLGFVLATVPLQGLLKTASIVTLFFPLLVLAVPILDTSFVVAKRLKYRQPVYVADRQHLHHRFVNTPLDPAPPARRMASVANPHRLRLRAGCPGRLRLHGVPARDRQARESDDQAARRAGSRRQAQVGVVQSRGFCLFQAVLRCYKLGMLRPDGAQEPPFCSVRRSWGCPGRSAFRLGRGRLVDRLVVRLTGNWSPDRRGDRDPARDLHGLLALPGQLLTLRSGLLTTPRPEPGHLLPALAGSLVILFALPLFLILGWNMSAWTLAAVLWLGIHALDFILRRARKDTGNLAASGMQAFGLLFKTLGLLVVLFATAAANPHLALAAALVYALAYTLELGLSMVVYFGAGR